MISLRGCLLGSVLALSLIGTTGFCVDADFQAGAAPYTPEQLHELLVGQNKMSVINFFGRMPNHEQGFDWIYEHLLIAVESQDQYYTTAVVASGLLSLGGAVGLGKC
ncbi:MAG: hypothetical protein EBT30_00065 [Verrucomicrobia bacterium]|nr:hypothetical protein [Verrucomicrobiota bacterium]